MPWPIKYHEKRPDKPKAGDLWPAPWLIEPHRRSELSAAYLRDHAGKRLPLIVRLPGHAGDFCIDGNYGHERWTVTGDPPNVTVSPSIHAVGAYHGWLQDGVLSDDIDGRRFD